MVVISVNGTTSERLPAKPRYAKESDRAKPLRDLLLSRRPEGKAEAQEASGTSLRDMLLALDPLNPTWVRQVNKAEAEYWRRSEGYRIGECR